MIGRTREIQRLKELYNSNEAELIAVYGRRRVGKTYLINETFKGKFTFRHAGLSPIEMDGIQGESPVRKQLKHFYNSLLLHGMKKSRCPDNWLDAFLMLEMFLQKKDKGQRMIVFLDELPWMDTQKSGFITAFEGFWNTWACYHNNLMVIVCGSATSWITDELINNHGGLYGRVTCEMKLAPFTLKECADYFSNNKIRISKYDIVQSYMIIGGIPYYLKYFEKGMSLAQNIDQLFFGTNAYLKNEYERLFASAFNNPEMMQTIVEFLSAKSIGYTRSEISVGTGYTKGGTLSKALKALEVSDFVTKYEPFASTKKESYYKLTDPFCIFYLRFVKNHENITEDFWQQSVTSQSIVSWRGFAFENVCLNHISQIKDALKIGGVTTKQSVWHKKPDDKDGTQIDLLIQRKDNVVNMCEMKYYGKEFASDKAYHSKIIERRSLIEEHIPKGMVVHSTLITTYGLKYNDYSGDFDNVITIEDLFC